MRSFRGVKRPGREVYHSSPSGAEVKNESCYTSTPGIRVHGVSRDESIITLLLFHVSLSSARNNFTYCESQYSDTSANEDNSFRNHIR